MLAHSYDEGGDLTYASEQGGHGEKGVIHVGTFSVILIDAFEQVGAGTGVIGVDKRGHFGAGPQKHEFVGDVTGWEGRGHGAGRGNKELCDSVHGGCVFWQQAAGRNSMVECEHIGHDVLGLHKLDDDEGKSDVCEVKEDGEGRDIKDVREHLGDTA